MRRRFESLNIKPTIKYVSTAFFTNFFQFFPDTLKKCKKSKKHFAIHFMENKRNKLLLITIFLHHLTLSA